MKNRVVKLLIVAMATMQLLTGCKKGNGNDSSNSNITSEISISDTLDSVLLTVGETEVTERDLYLYLIQYIYNNSLQASSITDQTKQSIYSDTVDEIKLEYVQYEIAKVTEGIEVTEDDKNSITTIGDKFYNYFGEEFLSKYGIDKDTVYNLFERQMYIDKLKNKSLTDLSNDYLEQFKEEYKDKEFFSLYYVLFPSIKYDGDEPVLDDDGNYIKLNEEEMKAQLEKATELHDKAIENQNKGVESGDLESLAEEYGVSFAAKNEYGFKGGYSEDLNKIIDNLENNEISDVVETDAGYMVVRMENNQDEDFKEYSLNYMAQQSASNLYPTLQQNWMSGAGADNIVADENVLNEIKLEELCKDMNENGFAIQSQVGGN